MTDAEIKIIRIKMFLLDMEARASERYHPILAELWTILNEKKPLNGEDQNAVEERRQARLEGI
jgi:hypothetical protein